MEKAPNSPEKTALHQCQTLIFWQERWAFRSTRSERSRNRRYDGKDESWDWHGHEDVQTRGLMLGPAGLWMRSLLIWCDAGPHAHVRGWYGDYGCPRGRQWLYAVLQVLSTGRSFQSESFEILLSFQSWALKIEIILSWRKDLKQIRLVWNLKDVSISRIFASPPSLHPLSPRNAVMKARFYL